MVHQYFTPHPALHDIVNNIMISEIKFDEKIPKSSFLFPPLPEHCLFFYPFDCMEVDYAGQSRQALGSCIIIGPQTEPVSITMGYHHLVIKVGFQPGGLYRLLGIPMQQLLRTEAFDAGELLGNSANQTNEQLRAANSHLEMKRMVENYLIQHLNKVRKKLPIDDVLSIMIREGGLLKVEQAASLSCLSNRQFERVFKERIGLSPKFFSRLVRFANAWVLKEAKPDTTWIELAHQCGYYDQMHLVRDFKDFTGENPSVIEKAMQAASISLHNRVFY